MADVKIPIDELKSYQDACDRAYEESKKHGCVQHVCRSVSGAYYISDWYDGSTVASFENGRRL